MAIVADVDEHSADDVIAAKEKCNEDGIEFYISNIDFEVWLLLHYEAITKWFEKDELIERLSKHLGKPYEKSEGISADDDVIDEAVKRGMKEIPCGEDAVEICLRGDRSRTTVNLLVNKLSDYV